MVGGVVPDRPGAFYPPTVLTNVRPGMPAFDEEMFGPAAAVIPVADEEEGILLANKTKYGLGAAVFTSDVARGERIAAERLEAGSCFVNDFVRSDPRLPFGGIQRPHATIKDLHTPINDSFRRTAAACFPQNLNDLIEPGIH